MNEYVGKMLLASKQMSKQPRNSFAHTAILVVKHEDSQGTFGLCINRASSESIGELYDRCVEHEQWKGDAENRGQMLYQGGPIGTDVFALHTNEEIGDIKVLPGIWFSARDGNVEEAFRYNGQRKIIIGYAGWSVGQLSDEIEHGSWHLVDATPEIIFSMNDQVDVWEKAVKEKGDLMLSIFGNAIKTVNAELN